MLVSLMKQHLHFYALPTPSLSTRFRLVSVNTIDPKQHGDVIWIQTGTDDSQVHSFDVCQIEGQIIRHRKQHQSCRIGLEVFRMEQSIELALDGTYDPALDDMRIS